MAALATVALTEDGSIYVISDSIIDASGSDRLTHRNDVPLYSITEREIACDCHKDVQKGSYTYTGNHNARSSKRRLVADFIKDREHLLSVSEGNP